jgi:hypothetical protein
VTCAQLQLNLRVAVHHAPDYVTTYHQQQAAFENLDGRLDSMCRPGADTLIFGDTTTDKHCHSSIESGVEQRERDCSPATELATTPVHITETSTEKKEIFITPSTDFGVERQAPHLQLWQSFQDSLSHSPQHSVTIAVIPNASTDEATPLSLMRGAYSEPSSGSVTREDTPSAETTGAALGVDSRPNLEVAEPTTSSGVAVTPYKPKKLNADTSILRNEMSGIPSPHDLEAP